MAVKYWLYSAVVDLKTTAGEKMLIHLLHWRYVASWLGARVVSSRGRCIGAFEK